MRELILKRIEELKIKNLDLFTKPNKKNKIVGFGKYYLMDYDWSVLNDKELVKEFEIFVYRCYRQR